jgi:hypothetical protein
VREGFLGSCSGGQLGVVQWLIATFGLDARDVREGNNAALRRCCESGHLAVAQWLVVTFDLTSEDARSDDNDALRAACAKGHLAAVQWLTSTFHLTTADARSGDNGALRESCRNGHLAVVQWLVATFGLTADDARNGRALRSSCMGGHLAVAQWLAAHFGFATLIGMIVFGYTCEAGQLAVAQWLAARFNPNAAVARNINALRRACSGGHLAMVQWLVTHFCLTVDDCASGFRVSCESGQLAVAQWLTSHFGHAATRPWRKNGEALVASLAKGQHDVAEWLVKTFFLSHLLTVNCLVWVVVIFLIVSFCRVFLCCLDVVVDLFLPSTYGWLLYSWFVLAVVRALHGELVGLMPAFSVLYWLAAACVTCLCAVVAVLPFSVALVLAVIFCVVTVVVVVCWCRK